jgi:lactobin A/cerein 7B family class IIb bacteriocin
MRTFELSDVTVDELARVEGGIIPVAVAYWGAVAVISGFSFLEGLVAGAMVRAAMK